VGSRVFKKTTGHIDDAKVDWQLAQLGSQVAHRMPDQNRLPVRR
jgi:hypothetical protein